MHSFSVKAGVCLAIAMVLCIGAYAELQNVQVGGEVRIRANYITNGLVRTSLLGMPEVRWPAAFLTGRPIGGPGAAGGFNGLGVVSPVKWDDDNGGDFDAIEHRTRLNVSADFTNDVKAFIEFDSYDIWGQDFRSDYITGADFAPATGEDVEVYQSYIETNNMFDLPLRLRLGRQELSFGSEWLVGPKDFVYFFFGRSFDGARLTYTSDSFTVDAFATELAEGGPIEEDEDVWFYGLYTTCTAVENHTFDLYWLWVRDARRVSDTNLTWFGEWMENIFDVDDYDPTNLHTVGFRATGLVGALDYEAEIAYQFGDAGQVGTTFKPFFYGDDDAEYDVWGGHFDVGYTFVDVPWMPRPFVGGAYFGGEDNRDISFWDWLNPFDRPEASVSFNRLFSNSMYCGAIDAFNDLSNCWLARAGVVAHPTESIDLILAATYFEIIEPWDAPVHFKVGRYRIPIAPALSFWTQENDDHLGWDTSLFAVYHYSEDLTFRAQYSRFWVGDGIAEGAFIYNNGLIFSGGTGHKDADYIAAEVSISF